MVDSKWLQRLQEDASNFTESMATDLVLKRKKMLPQLGTITIKLPDVNDLVPVMSFCHRNTPDLHRAIMEVTYNHN